MNLRTLSRLQLGVHLGYLDGEGKPGYRAIANLLRAPLNRWGLSPKRAVLQYVRAELRAFGVEDLSSVPRVLQRLVDIGECEDLYVGHESCLAPGASRWISVGDGIAAYLGVSEPPGGLPLVDGDRHDVVRRFRIDTDEDAATLELAGVQEVSLADWLVPPGYISHASRRLGRPARSDEVSLSDFWQLLENALTEEGLVLGADAEVRMLGGCPGKFFGRHNSLQPGGRWTTDPDDGLWCAYRSGYSDTHWHPCIIAVSGSVRKVLDLYDEDEWRWAVLARGRCVGPEEVVRADASTVQLTFPAPNQLRAAMDIVGRPTGAWAWNTSPGGPDPWQLLA